MESSGISTHAALMFGLHMNWHLSNSPPPHTHSFTEALYCVLFRPDLIWVGFWIFYFADVEVIWNFTRNHLNHLVELPHSIYFFNPSPHLFKLEPE